MTWREDFPEYERLDTLPLDEKSERPNTKCAPNLRVHATTEDNIDMIVKGGLLPMGETYCPVWPEDAKDDKILQCRYGNVYMWDDYNEGISQALATVSVLGSHNPALLVMDVGGIEDKLEIDPEVHVDGVDEEEPIAQMYEGAIAPERIKCVCTINERDKVDVGTLVCPLKNQSCYFFTKDGSIDWDNTFDYFGDTDRYNCRCRERM